MLDELCAALLRIGTATQVLPECPPEPDVRDDVRLVQDLDRELHGRGVDPAIRLASLTRRSTWMMAQLYTDCLSIPAVRPWVRSASDGLRTAFRCAGCRAREFPSDSRTVRLCDGCLDLLDRAIGALAVYDRLLLYRTYNPEARCEHAADDTVLGIYPADADGVVHKSVGLCRLCIAAERTRRHRDVSRVSQRVS